MDAEGRSMLCTCHLIASDNASASLRKIGFLLHSSKYGMEHPITQKGIGAVHVVFVLTELSFLSCCRATIARSSCATGT